MHRCLRDLMSTYNVQTEWHTGARCLVCWKWLQRGMQRGKMVKNGKRKDPKSGFLTSERQRRFEKYNYFWIGQGRRRHYSWAEKQCRVLLNGIGKRKYHLNHLAYGVSSKEKSRKALNTWAKMILKVDGCYSWWKCSTYCSTGWVCTGVLLQYCMITTGMAVI